jgi:S1-C subfamily serine protease
MRWNGCLIPSLVLAAACATTPSPILVSQDSRPPEAVFRAVQFVSETGRGWGAPVGNGQVLTVAHVVGERAHWISGSDGGLADLLWQDDERDLAMYRIEPGRLASIPLAHEEPHLHEPLWWRVTLQPGRVHSVARGVLLGMDDEGDLHIDGMTMPGASGSPVVNARGELVAVITAGFGQSFEPNAGEPVAEAINKLYLRTSFRPVTIARPVYGDRLPERAK